MCCSVARHTALWRHDGAHVLIRITDSLRQALEVDDLGKTEISLA
jgi:hypothetical protein